MSENLDSRDFYDLMELCEYLKVPDDWFTLPGAEALIPVNPYKWPAQYGRECFESKTRS